MSQLPRPPQPIKPILILRWGVMVLVSSARLVSVLITVPAAVAANVLLRNCRRDGLDSGFMVWGVGWMVGFP